MGRNIVRFHVVFLVRIRVMIWVVFWAFSSKNILGKNVFLIVNMQHCIAVFFSFQFMDMFQQIQLQIFNMTILANFP